MQQLANKRILVGVTGSIAAYKSPDLVRRLRAAGAQVRVVMTEGAAAFITPLTLQTVSGQPVFLHHLDATTEAAMDHIALARWADLILIAPASANTLARLAGGIADDLLTTICLASDAHLVLAPAMNQGMWRHAATQANARLVAERGVELLGPAEGEQACGDFGAGRMLEPDELVAAVSARFSPGLLQGIRVLVTSGPTHETIDPVRFIGNRSSGKMGHAIAAAAAEAGAAVTLVSGPVALEPLPAARLVAVRSAEEMYDAVLALAADQDIFVAAAAVADYRPVEQSIRKIKKTAPRMTLEMERTPDILATVAALPQGPFTVGFAAETEDLEENARAKLIAKGLDMVAANPVGATDCGMEADENTLHVVWADGGRVLARAPKARLARELVSVIAERFDVEKDPAEGS